MYRPHLKWLKGNENFRTFDIISTAVLDENMKFKKIARKLFKKTFLKIFKRVFQPF